MEFSNQYLTYGEYRSLGGTIQEMPFDILEFKARKKIDNATFNRLINLENQIQEVKLCIYELITEMQNYEQQGNITSENTDGYSVTYQTLETKQQREKYSDIIRNYLIECRLEDGTPYLYCGV